MLVDFLHGSSPNIGPNHGFVATAGLLVVTYRQGDTRGQANLTASMLPNRGSVPVI
jgi:hypothetical protein